METTAESDSGHQNEHRNSQGSEEELNSTTLDTVSIFSTCSSPLPPEPFEPLFKVKFTGEVSKDGDVAKFTLRSFKADNDNIEYVVQRQYEDFEWLEHCLITSNPISGVIIPPLPPKPAITSEMAEAKSKKQFGDDTRTMIGDEFHKDCRRLEQYLRLLLAHSVFGKDPALRNFLQDKDPPVRSKVKKGLFSRISDSIESRKSTHKDCEEFFQKERDWATKYGASIKETSEAFNSVIYTQQRLCSVLSHLATSVALHIGSSEDETKVSLRLGALFSQALEDIKHGLEVQTYNEENTLGAYLDLYSRYLEAEKEMLFRRTCLLVEYENANKVLDKAKPNKRELAEQTKLAAEKAFEECSDTARQEIKKFHRQRVASFQKTLEKFAEAELQSAKDTHLLLANSLGKLRDFTLADWSHRSKE